MSIWKKLTKPPQRFRWKACFLKTLPVVFSFKGRIILAWAFFQIWIFCLKVKTVVTQNFHFLWIPERVTALVFLLRSKLLPVLHFYQQVGHPDEGYATFEFCDTSVQKVLDETRVTLTELDIVIGGDCFRTVLNWKFLKESTF